MTCRKFAWSCCLAVVCAACNGLTPVGIQSAPGLTVVADSFHIALTDERHLSGAIAYRYVNTNPFTVGVAQCHNVYPPIIETDDSGTWKATYVPAVLLCAGPAVLIRPGETFEGTLHVSGCLVGFSCAPTWDSSARNAVARLAWGVYRLTGPVSNSAELPRDGAFIVTSQPFRITIGS